VINVKYFGVFKVSRAFI